MRLFGYYAFHTFVNSIKKLFRSTFVIIIAVIIGISMIFGVSAGIIASVVEKKNQSMEPEIAIENSYDDETQQEDTVDTTDQESSDDDEMTPEEITMVKSYVECGISLFMILFILFGIYSGTKKGSDIFMMADANFLFTAPLKPQSILMFRLVFQMAALIFGSMYLLFQIPNLMVNLGISISAIFFIIFAWILLLIYQKLFSVLSYTITATHEKLKEHAKTLVYVIAVLIIVYLGATYISTGKSLQATAESTFAAHWMRMIPIIGWTKGMVMTAVDGQILTVLEYAAFLILGVIVMIYGIWKIKADFYEDAMSGAQNREAIMAAAKEGRKVTGKTRSDKIKRNSVMKGDGGTVFFWKEIYNRRRFAKLGLITNTMGLEALSVLAVSIFCVKALNVSNYAIIGITLAVLTFFRNFGNPIAIETTMNWLFLVPDNAYKKVFSAMMVGSYSCVMDMIPALIIGAVFMPTNPFVIILWLLQIVTMDFLLSTAGCMLQALFPATAMDAVKSMIHMLIKFFTIFLIIIIVVIGYVISGITLGLILNIIVNVLIGAALFLIYPAMLHEGV